MAEKKPPEGEDLKAFKIGASPTFFPASDTPEAPASQPQAPVGAPDPQEDPRFPALERVIEDDAELEAVGALMGETVRKLEELVNGPSSSARAEAKKALAAYERTFDMIDHLLEVKAGLQQGEETAEEGE